MKNLVMSFFVLTSVLAQGQDLVNGQTLSRPRTANLYLFDNSDNSILGSPYLYEDFEPARIKADREIISNVRYNMISDDMEIIDNDGDIQV